MAQLTRREFLITGAALGSSLLASTSAPSTSAASSGNPIPIENQKSTKHVLRFDSPSLGYQCEGYPEHPSWNVGEVVQFRIHTSLERCVLNIFRLGFYNGRGSRLVASIPTPGVHPGKVAVEPVYGTVSPSDWDSIFWPPPRDVPSGVFVAQFASDVAPVGYVGAYIFFIIRDDSYGSDLLVQASDSTWQAYNQWGGTSLYERLAPGDPRINCEQRSHYARLAASHYQNAKLYPSAQRVSVQRPILEWPNCFDAEWRLIYWLEQNGYSVKYVSTSDVDRAKPSYLLTSKVFVSSGHDEYWSVEQRNNVELLHKASSWDGEGQ